MQDQPNYEKKCDRPENTVNGLANAKCQQNQLFILMCHYKKKNIFIEHVVPETANFEHRPALQTQLLLPPAVGVFK